MASVTLVPEGVVDECVLRVLIEQCGRRLEAGSAFLDRPGRRPGGLAHGRPTIAINALRYLRASAQAPCIILASLDSDECPPRLVGKWGLPLAPQPNFLCRIAVRAVESWLLADRQAMAAFLGINEHDVPLSPEACPNPKLAVVDLARRSHRKAVKTAMLPRRGWSRPVGPGYTEMMLQYIRDYWRIDVARSHAPSLDRAVSRIEEFAPVVR